MIKNVTEITGNSEKSELDLMTFHDVIRVANKKREGGAMPWHVINRPMKMLEKICIYLCLCQDQSVAQVGIPA